MRGGLLSRFRDFGEELWDGMLVRLISIVSPEFAEFGIVSPEFGRNSEFVRCPWNSCGIGIRVPGIGIPGIELKSC